MIGDVDDVASYTVLHDSTHVLRRGPSGLSIVESVGFIGEEAKGYARRHLKTMEQSINPALHAWVIVECVAVKVTELRCLPF